MELSTVMSWRFVINGKTLKAGWIGCGRVTLVGLGIRASLFGRRRSMGSLADVDVVVAGIGSGFRIALSIALGASLMVLLVKSSGASTFGTDNFAN